MPASDPRIDAYIAAAAPFARPVLEHLRGVVHAACPDAEEALKWGMPSFLYRGAILAGMAAFKQHASFHVWRRDGGDDKATAGMGQFGKLTAVDDLPPAADLIRVLQAAMAGIEARKAGVAPVGRRIPKPALPVPDALRAALDADVDARVRFEAMTPGCRREYIEWITEAKREDTRARRVAQLLEQVREGRSLHWKYQRP